MDIAVLLIRSAIALTFLILAAGGPYAIIELRSFIKTYKAAHTLLEKRVKALEQWRKTHEEKEK